MWPWGIESYTEIGPIILLQTIYDLTLEFQGHTMFDLSAPREDLY